MLGSDLTLSYRGAAVVHNASIRLARGRVTALVGPNGSGKSTLLRALARLHDADSGRILIARDANPAAAQGDDGVCAGDHLDDLIDASRLSRRDFACRVTLLTQSRPTPSGLSVYELVEFGRHPHRGRWVRGDDNGASVIAGVMEMTGITALAENQVDQLSGGQLQRVWLACALAQDTDVLLLDEPTTYLDLRYQVELLDLIRDLADKHGVTVGVVLHDLDQAAAIADHVVLLDSGRVLARGTPADVLTGDLLSSAYGIRVDVEIDDATGYVTTRARGRHNSAARTA